MADHLAMSAEERLNGSPIKTNPAWTAKLDDFKSLIYGSETVNIRALRQACMAGIPEERGIRAVTWKLLLHLLPTDRGKWREALRTKRKQYKGFCEDFIVDPKTAQNCIDVSPLDKRQSLDNGDVSEQHILDDGGLSDVTIRDHPLALDAYSKWNLFFQDSEIREQIDRDVMRTHPDMHFFSGEENSTAEIHREEIKRALFVFAKLNPGLTYVQGMNEIYAPLYYVFRTCEHGEYGEQGGFGSSEHAEADAFFCFVDLMAEFRDNFCKHLDDSTSGVRAAINRFSQMLQRVDPILWDHLKNKSQVDHHYFAFRWITLLLTQEFAFPDVLRLWDTLAAAKPNERQSFLHKVCIAMLLHVRRDLLNGDYSQNLKLLQQFPACDMDELIRTAIVLDTRGSSMSGSFSEGIPNQIKDDIKTKRRGSKP